MSDAGKTPAKATDATPKGQGVTSTFGPSPVSGAGKMALPSGKPLEKAAPVGSYVPPTITDYDAWYKKQPDVSEAQLTVDIGYLRRTRNFADVEKALTGYLKYHSKHAAPWMYELLALSMEMNGRPNPEMVRTAIGWAAHLAMRSRDPVALIAACDNLMLHKYDQIDLPGVPAIKTAEMLDLAMSSAPHRPEPIGMALLFAEQKADPKRMGDALDHLFSLGWTGVDETWRLDGDRRAKALAKALKAEGKNAEAQALLDLLGRIESRDIVVRMSWQGDAMLDLIVDEPLGATADHFHFRTVFGGTLVKEGRIRDKEAVYTSPRAFDGEYTVRANVLFDDEKKPITTATVEIVTHEGTSEEKREIKTLVLGKSLTFQLQNGRRTQALPLENLPRRLPERDFEAERQKAAAKQGDDPKAKTAPAGSAKPANKPKG